MGYGLLGSVFNFLDPIIDEINPGHNEIQTWTTGSSTTKGQRPYFETIAPIILDAFLPGVGSAVGAVDKASTGNWGGAAISALGAIGGMGGFSGGTEATQAAKATEAAPALASTAGDAGGSAVASGSDAVSVGNNLSAADYGAQYGTNTYGDGYTASEGLLSTGSAEPSSFTTNSFGQPANEFGYSGLSSPSSSASNTQFMVTPTSQFSSAAGVGGAGQGLEGTASMAAANQASPSWYSKLNTPSVGKMSGILGEQMLKQQAQKEQMAMEQKARAQQAMSVIAGDAGGPAKSYSIQTASPYAQFNGGFNPRRYGANVRKQGLLG